MKFKLTFQTLVFITVIFIPINIYGQIWDSLGVVIPGNPKYIEEHNGNLFISKLSGSANGKNLFGLGEWDGAVWDSVGGGIDGIVYGSALYNSKVFFGGIFQYAGGPYPGGLTQPINNLTAWDGLQYLDLQFPSNSEINTLRVYKNELYIGLKSLMPIINGQTYSGILKYNDTTFSDVGGGVFQNFRQVIAMAEFNGDLIVAGRFDLAGTLPVNNIARWDGTQWHAMGDGLNYFVRSLLVDTINNILYAGGTFTHSGSILTPSIAKWNGSTWQPIDSSLTSSVTALTFYKGSLYAGVTSSFGQNPSSILKWTGTNWDPIIPYPDGNTACLKVYQDWLYVASGNMIDNVSYNGLARYKDTTSVGLTPDIQINSYELTIHPNPSGQNITISVNKPIRQNVEILMYNINGEIVLKDAIASLEDKIDIVLPNGISSGLYVCNFLTKDFKLNKNFVIDKR